VGQDGKRAMLSLFTDPYTVYCFFVGAYSRGVAGQE